MAEQAPTWLSGKSAELSTLGLGFSLLSCPLVALLNTQSLSSLSPTAISTLRVEVIAAQGTLGHLLSSVFHLIFRREQWTCNTFLTQAFNFCYIIHFLNFIM